MHLGKDSIQFECLRSIADLHMRFRKVGYQFYIELIKIKYVCKHLHGFLHPVESAQASRLLEGKIYHRFSVLCNVCAVSTYLGSKAVDDCNGCLVIVSVQRFL